MSTPQLPDQPETVSQQPVEEAPSQQPIESQGNIPEEVKEVVEETPVKEANPPAEEETAPAEVVVATPDHATPLQPEKQEEQHAVPDEIELASPQPTQPEESVRQPSRQEEVKPASVPVVNRSLSKSVAPMDGPSALSGGPMSSLVPRSINPENWKNLSSGISAGAEVSTDMMKAIVHQKKIQDEQQQIKSRIVKLRKEEEKANKRIRDYERRHKFVKEMQYFKHEKFMMLKTTNCFHKEVEERNREKFTNDRSNAKQRIEANIKAVHTRNRSHFEDIKTQKKKIAEIISMNKEKFFQEKQHSFQQIKELSLRAKSHQRNTLKKCFNSNQQDYFTRIESRYKDAEKTKMASQILEQEEADLVHRLQLTINRERALADQLNDTQKKGARPPQV